MRVTCGGSSTCSSNVDPNGFPELADVAEDIEAGRALAIATVVAHPIRLASGRVVVRPDGVSGWLGSNRMNDAVTTDAPRLLESGSTRALHYGANGETNGRRRYGPVRQLHAEAAAPRLRGCRFRRVPGACRLIPRLSGKAASGGFQQIERFNEHSVSGRPAV